MPYNIRTINPTDSLKCIQINLNHSIAATAEINRRSSKDLFHIGLIQEPYIVNNEIKGLNTHNNKVIYNTNSTKPRAAIVLDKNIKSKPITELYTCQETELSTTTL